MILVDSSVWIDYFNGSMTSATQRLDVLLGREDLAVGDLILTEVLQGFDLHIKAGERVALVGPSGSGKSTVAMLVSRFYDPNQGSVSVDGHDLRRVTLPSLRHQIGVVFEESFLFSDSVRSNIAYGHPEASDLEVERAAREVGAHAFIATLPQGYHTAVSEQGKSLSAGERQLLSLARALLVDPAGIIYPPARVSTVRPPGRPDERTALRARETVRHGDIMADGRQLQGAGRAGAAPGRESVPLPYAERRRAADKGGCGCVERGE